ncbi:twin-arginine translocase TatA/TatE family subunit [candidate division KSB3 bacterium]|uniref:Sec-independent protein translocase protein TatA n=1 Tax=candidate division KSB3 bacterium TaxID=2044937 RepID=A0A2G6E3N9_9BACT|nr:MAG: twin-arginine translocase TatA/TatE family subunit [candidate division KSB3 bacterium]PIE29116.1 MAG: twin-arginine translocase TatA/TatE family subunit [candidate division KSB3 bacterium]
MFGLGPTELSIILVIVLVIFGAKRLPEIGSSLGKGITNFKNAIKDRESLDAQNSDGDIK